MLPYRRDVSTLFPGRSKVDQFFKMVDLSIIPGGMLSRSVSMGNSGRHPMLTLRESMPPGRAAQLDKAIDTARPIADR